MIPCRWPLWRLLARVYAALLLALLLARRTPLSSVSPLALGTDFLPFAYLPLPVALGVARCQRSRWLRRMLVGLAGAFVALYGRRLLRSRPASRPPGTITVITANVLRGARNAAQVAALVLRERPDCFALQELDARTCQRLIAMLASEYPYHVTGPHPGYRGLGWWSRYPLRKVVLVCNDEQEPLALAAEMRGPLGPLHLVTAHPTVPLLGPWEAGVRLYDGQIRDCEVERILRGIEALPAPLILAGDFNLTEQSAAYGRLTSLLDDAFATAGRGFGHTFPVFVRIRRQRRPWPVPLVRLDYIFHTRDLEAMSAAVLPSVGSDHYPVGATLRPRPGSVADGVSSGRRATTNSRGLSAANGLKS